MQKTNNSESEQEQLNIKEREEERDPEPVKRHARNVMMENSYWEVGLFVFE